MSGEYTEIKPLDAIRAFCYLSIFIGIASIAIQIAALCFAEYPSETLDTAGAGIWAGIFYIVSGSFGLAGTAKKTKALIFPTVALSGVSIAAAVVATVLSGVSMSYFCNSMLYGDECDSWYALEWTLMGISIYAFCNSIVLTILMSVALCTGKPSRVV